MIVMSVEPFDLLQPERTNATPVNITQDVLEQK
jgi:hypothetical protein